MELSTHSALSIFCNPKNLIFFVGHDRSGRKYNVYVSFGPSRNCRPIITSRPVFENQEKAIDCLQAIIDGSLAAGERERKGGQGVTVTGLLLGAEGPFFDQALRDRVLADLRSENHQADTYEYE